MSSKLNPKEILSKFIFLFAEKSQDVFWIRGKDYHQQIYISPAYERIWGRNPKELFKNPELWNQYIHPDDYKRLSESLKKRSPSSLASESYVEHYRIIRPNGKIRWIRDYSFPIHENKKLIGFAGIASDITKDIVKEEKLRKEKERAEIANQAKSNFLATISHELRTPLNGIIGIAQLLQKDDLSKSQKEHIADILQSSHNLLALVNDILFFAKLENGQVEIKQSAFNIKELVNEIKKNIIYQINEKHLILKVDLPDKLPNHVIGDPLRIKQILNNFLVNAIKFTRHGEIELSVLLKKENKKQVITFKVKDTGIGIPEEKLTTIFDRFFQIESHYNRRFEGVGLGLSICKELAEAMGGKVGVESELHKGSTFWFSVPLSLSSSKKNIAKQINDKALMPMKFHSYVLLVEDNIINQKVTKAMLEDLGCRYDLATTGSEALNLIKNNKYDLILMDISLPDTDGITATKKIRKSNQNKSLPIIALTAHALEDEIQNFIKNGMNEVITKPIDFLHLQTVLSKYSS